MERDLEPERVVVGQHPAAPIGEDPALGGAAAEGADHLLDVEAGLERQDDPLGDAEVGPGEDHLVDGLDRLAAADRTDVGDRLARSPRGSAGLVRRRPARPPTKIVRVAFWAPSEPPETGASAKSTPCSASRAAMSRVAPGAIVEQSITSWPGRAPSASPPGPNRTASTSGVSETHSRTTSLAAPRPPGVAASVAPASTSSAARPGRAIPDGHRAAGADEVPGHRRTHRAQAQEADPFHAPILGAARAARRARRRGAGAGAAGTERVTPDRDG